MPELPEVEIARESLERWLLGRRIREVRASDRRLLGRHSRKSVESALRGAIARSITRRGKFLVLHLGSRRPRVLAHLGMTGRFDRLAKHEPLPRFAKVVLSLPRGERVVFSDPRRLGAFRLLDEREHRRLAALGLEPLEDAFTANALYAMTRVANRPIKLLLMDQSRVAGIGNIQAAEALFLARIHPMRPANDLTRVEVGRLARGIRRAIATEIERFRAERVSYVTEGAPNHFRVYGRAGEPCRRCRTTVAKVVQSARSSYYCPSCQPENGNET